MVDIMATKDLERNPDCKGCQYNVKTGWGPSHDGSKFCESHSLASGGKNDHCTCDRCF